MTATFPIAAFGAGMFVGAWLIVWIAVFVFWLWMLIDCLTRPMDSMDKLLWFLVIFFLPLIGSILYLVLKRPSSTPNHPAH